MSSKRASVNPLAGFLKPHSPLKGLLLSIGTVRSCRGRGSSRSCKRKRQRQEEEAAEGEARGRSEAVMKRPVGRPCMLLAPRASLLLSQPLQTLPLGHPHRVSEDAKRVASLIEECTKLSFSPCRQWSACTAACTAAAAAGAGGQAQESKPQPQPQPQPLLQTVHKQHWALELKNYFPTGPSRSALELEN